MGRRPPQVQPPQACQRSLWLPDGKGRSSRSQRFWGKWSLTSFISSLTCTCIKAGWGRKKPVFPAKETKQLPKNAVELNKCLSKAEMPTGLQTAERGRNAHECVCGEDKGEFVWLRKLAAFQQLFCREPCPARAQGASGSGRSDTGLGSRGPWAPQAGSTAATDGREGYCLHAPLWDINKNSKNVLFSFFILFMSIHTSSFQFCMIWVTHTVGRVSSKANCFQQNFWKTVYIVPLLCTHLFSLCFFCLAFELVELFTPPYPIPRASRGNDDPSLPQRCCEESGLYPAWKKNWTKYNYYCLAGCICNYWLVNMSFGEVAHNHNDQCPAWVAAQAQGCCISLGLPAAWAGAQAQGSAGQRHDDHGGTFQQLEYQHCSPGWCQAITVNNDN